MRTTSDLMNSVYSRVMFAPTDFGIGGGGQQQQQQPGGDSGADDLDTGDFNDEDFESDNFGLDDDLLDLPEDDRKKIKDDMGNFVSDLMSAGDDNDDDAGESAEEIAAAETALAEELKAGLKNLRLPDNLIPEDFDPSNPAQLTQVLNSVQINAAQNAIALMFKPVQATLNRMSTMMRREMREAVESGVNGNNAESQLRAAIPAIDNPAVAPYIRQTFQQALKKYPGNTKAAIVATRKTLSTIGVNLTDTGRAPSGRTNRGGSNVREGASALDGLGLRLPPANTRNGNRMR